MSVPPHLQSTVELLARAFGDHVSSLEYAALLAFLGEHLCEENLGIVVAACFGLEPALVINDVWGVPSVRPPSSEAVEAVRARLQAAGLREWLAEDEASGTMVDP